MRISDRGEIWALTVLSHLFFEYKKLQKSENPDFVDRENSIGVEVTYAANRDVMEAESYYFNRLKNVVYEECFKDSLNKLKNVGLQAAYLKDSQGNNSGKPIGLLRVFGSEEFSFLHEAIQKKYSKKYEKLNQLDLYISFSQVCRDSINDNEFKKLLQTAHECEKEHEKVFSNILIDFSNDIVVLNTRTDEITDIKYNSNKIYEVYEKIVSETENGKKEKQK